MRRSLTKEERLRSRRDIGGVFRHGTTYKCRGMILKVRPNEVGHNRIVVAPPRKAGSAVVRNRLRRIGTEAYRTQKELFACGYDCAIIVFPGDFSFEERKEHLRTLCRRAGLLKPDVVTNGATLTPETSTTETSTSD
jgi:ribonuclease P protein component